MSSRDFAAEQERLERERKERQKRQQEYNQRQSENLNQEIVNGLVGLPTSATAIAIDIATPGGLF